MDKYTLDFLKNKLNEVIVDCNKPQKKCFHQLVRQIFIKGTPILRHLVQNDGRNVKPEARKFSRHLENAYLAQSVDDFILKQVKHSIENDTTIAYDLCDINKNEAKKMENLSMVFDGSKRKRAQGFWMHGIGALGFMLKFEMHQSDSKTLPQTRKKTIYELAEKFRYKGIWVMDRGNDSKQFFRDLAKKNINFICRMRKKRLVVLKDTGEIIKLSKLKPGKYEIYLLNHHNNRVETDIVYTLIISKHLEDNEEIRLISNLPFDKYSEDEFVKKYLKRWGVEKNFRTIKTKFLVEKIRVLSENRFVNLLSLIRLVMAISLIIYQKIFDTQKHSLLNLYQLIKNYNSFLKRKALTQNPDSFITFLAQNLPVFANHKVHKPPNLSLFSNYALEKMTPI